MLNLIERGFALIDRVISWFGLDFAIIDRVISWFGLDFALIDREISWFGLGFHLDLDFIHEIRIH